MAIALWPMLSYLNHGCDSESSPLIWIWEMIYNCIYWACSNQNGPRKTVPQILLCIPAYDLPVSWWRHNGHSGVLNHQPHHCLLSRVFRRRSKKTSTLRVTCLCAGNSPVAGEPPAQMASNAENVSIWWRHHVIRDAFHRLHFKFMIEFILIRFSYCKRNAFITNSISVCLPDSEWRLVIIY